MNPAVEKALFFFGGAIVGAIVCNFIPNRNGKQI